MFIYYDVTKTTHLYVFCRPSCSCGRDLILSDVLMSANKVVVKWTFFSLLTGMFI